MPREPVTPNPITPVLTQWAPPPVFEQLSSAVFQVETRLSSLLIGIDVRRSASFSEQGPAVLPALRVDSDIAVAMLNQSESSDLLPGTFVFTTDGAFAGLVANEGGRPTLVPGEVVKTTVDRLRLEGHRDYGQLGIEVQPLTPSLASNTGAQVAVVVTWVDPQAPAAGQVNVTDVIVTMGDESLSTYDQWRARIARLTAGETVVLGVRRNGGVQTVTLTARPVSTPAEPRPLGLTKRTIRSVGVEVLGVTPASAAAQVRA